MRQRSALLLLTMVLALWLGAASSAEACAVCGGNTPEDQRVAFIVTTGLLTFLPLGMLFGGFFWLRRRVRELEAKERAQLEANPNY